PYLSSRFRELLQRRVRTTRPTGPSAILAFARGHSFTETWEFSMTPHEKRLSEMTERLAGDMQICHFVQATIDA
ncbi:MAG: hypothetical protein QGF59_09215, partial [Pirellulaceae bacterium]|nr:hypothetical protein [Pirellulaceae bacterium]